MLYCIFCYLVVFGILLNEHEHLEDWTWDDVICFILAPIIGPIVIGMHINKRNDDDDEK